MVWSIDWDGQFIVGGDDRHRLTPNFRLQEFKSGDGSIRVHRELISALQILRTRFGRPVSVTAVKEGGLGALISAASQASLTEAAERAGRQNLFAAVEPRDDAVGLTIPDPAGRHEIELEQALETAFSVTSGFETSGDRFQQVTGNFDGAGLSFGPVQWNFKSNTLEPLFRKFQDADEDLLRSCFEDPIDYDEWLHVLDLPTNEQIDWANVISTGSRGHDVQEPWKGYLRAVGRQQPFRAIMVEEALRKYGARLLKEAVFLRGLRPDVSLDHLRCMCALYDLVVQQGSLSRARPAIERRVAEEEPEDQFRLLEIAVEERGQAANPQWRTDCLSRRFGILNGAPRTFDNHRRDNQHFYMLRDVHIRDARHVIETDVDRRLARVSETLAAGDTLLA